MREFMTKRSGLVPTVGAILALLGVSVSATPSEATTYNVDLVVGGGTVTGSIQTDGTLGPLATTNITGYSLNLVEGLLSATLNPGNSSFDGSGFTDVSPGSPNLTATATQLFYNFGLVYDAAFYLNANNNTIFCLHDAAGACSVSSAAADADGGAPAMILGLGNGSFTFTPESGDVCIAGECGTTPLPAALPLFATGLGGLGLLGWRRRRKVQATAA